MTKFIRTTLAPLAAIAVIGACAKSGDAPADSRQVELAPAATAQPQLSDTAQVAAQPLATSPAAAKPAAPAAPKAAAPKATVPAPTPAPTPAPRPAAPTTGTIAGGTALSAMSEARVCTNTGKVGDEVQATLSDPVTGTNGVSVPAGAVVTLRVTEAKRGENGKEGIRLAFEPVSVSYGGATYPVNGSVHVASMETVRAQTTGDQAKKVAAGAAVGAIAGQLLGKKTKSTVVGAAVGAAAGGAVAAGTADWNGCLAQGGRVTVTLAGPLTVKVAP